MYMLKPICTRIDLTVAKATRSMVRNVEEVALRTSGDWWSVIAVSTVAWRMKESGVLRNVVLHGSMEMVGLSVSVGDGLFDVVSECVFVDDWDVVVDVVQAADDEFVAMGEIDFARVNETEPVALSVFLGDWVAVCDCDDVIVCVSVIGSEFDGVVESENVLDALEATETEIVATADLVAVPVNDVVFVAVWVTLCDWDAVTECDKAKVGDLVWVADWDIVAVMDAVLVALQRNDSEFVAAFEGVALPVRDMELVGVSVTSGVWVMAVDRVTASWDVPVTTGDEDKVLVHERVIENVNVATPDSDAVDEIEVSVVVLEVDFERVGEDVRVSVALRLLVDEMDGDGACDSDSVLVDVSVTPGEVDRERLKVAVLVGE
jgi:hypothetical protein